LSDETRSDLHQVFEASVPLHFEFNPFLNSAWNGIINEYTGSKAAIPLYTVTRSALTNDFKTEFVQNVTLNEVLKEVSGRPFEVHHLLYKAHYPSLAATSGNLMLTERSESEAIFGPGEHELEHRVGSGNAKDKYKILLPEYVDEYNKWFKTKTGAGFF